MGRDACTVWLKIHCTSPILKLQQKGIWKKILSGLIKTSHKQNKIDLKEISGLLNNTFQKRGNLIGYDGFKRILGTKIHVAVEKSGLPVSIVCSSANEHDSTKFIDVMENISEFVDDSMMDEIVTVYAERVMMQNTSEIILM